MIMLSVATTSFFVRPLNWYNRDLLGFAADSGGLFFWFWPFQCVVVLVSAGGPSHVLVCVSVMVSLVCAP